MKKLLSVLISTTLALSSFIPTYASGINVKINGQQVQFTQESGSPFIDGARTLVPFRVTMETFGATVTWDKENQTAIAQKNGVTVKVPVGTSYIFVNGTQKLCDTKAQIKDGRIYLPIRVVLEEGFMAKVQWENSTNTVIIETENKSESTDIPKTITEENKDSLSYEEFRDIFNYEGEYVQYVRIVASYNGKMNRAEFKIFWENLPDNTKELYLTKIAKEKQLLNKQYNVDVLFFYFDYINDDTLFLGFSKADTSNNVGASVRNPFEEIKLNPVD